MALVVGNEVRVALRSSQVVLNLLCLFGVYSYSPRRDNGLPCAAKV